MNLRLNRPFNMTAGPQSLTPFSDYLKATYGRVPTPFLYPSLKGLGQCMDYGDWTSTIQAQNCDQYDAGSSDAIACNASNNNIAIAIQEIQEQYGDCVPDGSVVTVDPGSGNWSVSQPVPACPSNDPNCRGVLQATPDNTSAYVSSTDVDAGNYGAITVQPVAVSSPVVSTPVVYSAPATAAPTPVQSAPVSTPIQATPILTMAPSTGTSASAGAVQAVQQATSGTAPATSSTACSGLAVGSTCIDSTTLMIGAGALVVLLLLVKR